MTMAMERVPGGKGGARVGARVSAVMAPVEQADPQMLWLLLADCADEDPELFYDCGSPVTRERARAVCGGCLVREDCLESVMAEEGALGGSPEQNKRRRYGVRAGLTSGQRWAMAYPAEAEAERAAREAKRKLRKSAGEDA